MTVCRNVKGRKKIVLSGSVLYWPSYADCGTKPSTSQYRYPAISEHASDRPNCSDVLSIVLLASIYFWLEEASVWKVFDGAILNSTKTTTVDSCVADYVTSVTCPRW